MHLLSTRSLLLLLTFTLSLTVASTVSGEPGASDWRSRIEKPETLRGVVVLAGLGEASSIVELARKAPVVILVVAPGEKERASLERALDEAGLRGQVSTVLLDATGRVPLTDWTAARVLADREALPALEASELRRILRPGGVLDEKVEGAWKRSVMLRPEGMDDWPSYDKDAASSQHSRDTLVGPPRGLQWVAGPTIRQPYTLSHEDLTLSLHRPDRMDSRSTSLIARDAFSGIPRWERRDLVPRNRFAVIIDEKRVILHPESDHVVGPHTIALDRETGETVFVFDQGLDCTVTEKQRKEDREALSRQAKRTEDLQLKLVDGALVQVLREEVIVLDATTGRRRWSRTAREGEGFVHPVAGNGRLFVVEGPYQRHSSYTHWPMARPGRILALSLEDGSESWKLDWDEERQGRPHAVYNLQLEGDRLAGAVTVYTPQRKNAHKPRPHGLIVEASTGKVLYFGREEHPHPRSRRDYAWPGHTGAGHSHVRLHLRGDKAWTVVLGHPVAFWNVDRPEDFTCFAKLYSPRGQPHNLRPVSCTVWRSTPNWWFGGLGCYPTSGQGPGHFNRSGRSDCDIGAFPANGLLYSPPNACHCQPYLPGTKAYHPREAQGEIADEKRLTRGVPAPDSPEVDEPGWPQWQGGAARRAWATGEYSVDPEKLWSWTTQARGNLPELLESQWSSDAIITGPLSQASCVGDLLVVAEAHRQAIVGLDSKTGEVRWRTPVDGRVDLSPSLHRGLVFAGTRNGRVYALRHDTGAIVWSFLAAPREDRIAVNGQLESPWPVFGAIPVDDHGLIAIAGRHTANDGGLWWWQLDPKTGEIQSHGRIHEKAGEQRAANFLRRLPLGLQPVQNSVPVMTDQWFCLPGSVFRRQEGRLGVPGDEDGLSEKSRIATQDFLAVQHEEQVIRMGSNALIGEKSVTVGGWRKPFYGKTIARIFAIDARNRRFVSVGGGVNTASARGGGGDSTVHRMTLLGSPVSERRGKRYVEQDWEYRDPLLVSRGQPSITALAASDRAVYLGLSILASGAGGRDARAKMPHRLRILDQDTGELIRDVAVPARVLQGGIALAGGKIFVTTEDGTVTAFGKKDGS